MKTRNYYNICISILEAKYLAWIDSKTYVEIEIDGKKKSTKVKECSDRPFFNEYFVFEVKKSLKNLMSTDIEISMYKPKGNLRNKTFLASTKLDIGTVWNRKDHQFYHEWFTLRHRAKEKGFLQCDIRIMSADSEPMHQLSPSFGRGLSLYKKDDIDGIIGVAVYFLRIYRGGDFYNFHQSKKHAKISISITFCGITMKSSDQRDTVNPVWNEEFKILSPFPPVHYKLKLDLLINDKEVSSVGILMDELSGTHETLKGFLPTFGPAHKYFYSSHNTYLGYVIFSLETIEMRDGREDSKSGVLKRVQISGLVEEKHFGFQYFSCYCMIYEVSMLDKSLCLDQELTVSIELGREGRLAFNETNVTKPIVAEETEGNYCWLSFGRRKPCLFVKDNLPDTRWRLFMTNSLKRLCKKFDDKLFLVNNEDDTSQKTKIIIDALKVLKIDCESLHFINGSTQLDKDRMNFIKNLVSKISIEASRIIRGNNFKKMYNDSKVVLDDLKKFAKDPQDSLPSIIMNIWKNNKRIYSCRIQPEDVIFANTQNFSGSSCGQLETVFMEKLPSKLSSRKNSAKLVACIWMGIQNDIAHWHDAFPGGLAYCSKFHSTIYEDRHPLSSMESSPTDSITSPTTEVPACIQYRNCFDCICHVYIEQAYFEDQSLFHKPSHNRVRVVFQNRSSETHEEFGMQQVVWSESLSTGPVTLYGDKHYFENHPEVIVVEVWQRKKKVSLVGNICLRAKLKRGDSVSKDLECHDIIQESTRVGKLFICAELIEIGEETEASFPKFDRTMFPSTSTAKYRLEVYFWGVRDLKYQSAKNICIKITVGKYSLSSSPLIIQKGSIYFTKQDIIVNDMILPKSKLIAPMMIINLIDTIEEGNRKEKIYKGCCSIADIHDKFEYCLITPDEWRQVQKFDKQNLISLRESFNYIDYSETHRKKSFFKKVAFKPPELLLDVLWLLKKAIFYVLDSVKKVFSKYQILDDNSWMHSENLAEPVLRVKKEGKHDWWSKYFNSKKLVEDLNNNGRMEGESITIYSTKNQPSLEFYAGELENYFNGFTDCLKVFKLTQSKINEDPENKTFCKVKAAIVLYEVPQPGQKLFTRNGCPLDDSTPVLSSHVVASKNFPPSCDSSSSPLPLSPHLPSISPPIPASSLPPTSSQRLMLRFYIVQAFNLYAKHGQSLNPYISASVSSASVERFATYLTDQSNPCFGMSFELAAELPKDYELTVEVMNFVRFGKNELIGETKIDLENRFYTKHRARCGLQTSYETKGFNSWRDQLKPSDILENLCKENGLPAPLFLPNCIIVAGKEFIFSPLDTDSKEERSLNVLLRWEEIPIVGCKLVREHVETRPLYKPQYPGIIQGYIEMWVDMFDLSEPHPDPYPLPPLLDITPREPQAYELRVIIYKTCKVFLVDNTVSVGYKHSDIYVKGWMLGKADSQSTDVHHKSITGDGNFNWRFIFPFKYLSAEGCITPNADLQTSASSKKKSQLTKVPPRIYLQVCDKERLFSDQFIGLLSLDLRYMIKGATRWWLCQSHVDESPKNTLNLFEERKTRGWWPFYGSQRFRQRNKITGYLEAEFHLVNYLEALRSPVGYGRNEPDGLPDPKRKIVRFTFWLLPCRVFLHMIGLNKLTILFFLAISGVVLFVLLGIYAIPSTVVQRMIGGH